MAIGRVRIEITGLERARLLMIELNELERDLDVRGEYDLSARLGRAISRFTKTNPADDVREAPDSDDGLR